MDTLIILLNLNKTPCLFNEMIFLNEFYLYPDFIYITPIEYSLDIEWVLPSIFYLLNDYDNTMHLSDKF